MDVVRCLRESNQLVRQNGIMGAVECRTLPSAWRAQLLDQTLTAKTLHEVCL